MRELSKTAECSKAIREELKKEFPGVKFKVNSESGSAINIHYVDGPSYESVDKIVSKYEMGHFDGMTDIYEYDNRREEKPNIHDSYNFNIPVISSIQSIDWNMQWKNFINKYNFSNLQ